MSMIYHLQQMHTLRSWDSFLAGVVDWAPLSRRAQHSSRGIVMPTMAAVAAAFLQHQMKSGPGVIAAAAVYRLMMQVATVTVAHRRAAAAGTAPTAQCLRVCSSSSSSGRQQQFNRQPACWRRHSRQRLRFSAAATGTPTCQGSWVMQRLLRCCPSGAHGRTHQQQAVLT